MGLVILRLTTSSLPEKDVTKVVLTGCGCSAKEPGSVNDSAAEEEETTGTGKAEGNGATGVINIADAETG